MLEQILFFFSRRRDFFLSSPHPYFTRLASFRMTLSLGMTSDTGLFAQALASAIDALGLETFSAISEQERVVP